MFCTVLSREKINHLSKVITESLQVDAKVRIQGDPNDLRLRIVQMMTDVLSIEQQIDRSVRRTLESYGNRLPEGAREWDVMYDKLYEEECQRRRL